MGPIRNIKGLQRLTGYLAALSRFIPQVQKLLYAVRMATRKLLHYFTDHEVTVVTSYPLGDIIRNRDTVGWISKWALELMGHDIRNIPRTAIKS